MPETVLEFLRRIEPRQVDSKGKPKYVPDSRLRNFAAIKEVLTTGGTIIDYRGLSFAVAERHGADKEVVWRRVRRFRERSLEQSRTPDPYRQLELPLPENSTEQIRRRGP
jgi:hypothetical protein